MWNIEIGDGLAGLKIYKGVITIMFIWRYALNIFRTEFPDPDDPWNICVDTYTDLVGTILFH